MYFKKTSRPVVTRESLFQNIKKCHERVGHSGREKTWSEVQANYSWIRYDIISLFLKTCSQCSLRKPLKNRPCGKPIISLGFLSRLQIDLIDMTSRPDQDFKWILHMRDHFSKFNWAYPLKSKRALEVADKLVDTFHLFGAPKILQSDNGKEFVAMVIKELINTWKGLVIINGRPRHPQSQGCVERGNGDLQIKLGKWMEDNTESWTKGLKFVVYSINTSISATTGKTPYEIVFGQSARCHLSELEELASQDLLDESELEDIVETELIIPERSQTQEDIVETEMIIPEKSQFQKDIVETDLIIPGGSQIMENIVETELIGPEDSQIHSEPNSRAIPCNSSPLDNSSNISLLFNQSYMVAKGIRITNRSTLHGHEFNVDTHAIFQLTEVDDAKYIPEDNNPFEEPLNVVQYALWKLEDVILEESNTPHSIIRKCARANYLKRAHKQQERYDNKCAKIKKCTRKTIS